LFIVHTAGCPTVIFWYMFIIYTSHLTYDNLVI
jgi:hypothetical protein